MMPNSIEAELFEVAHELLHESSPAASVERREVDRRDFRCTQLLAFYNGRNLPLAAQFHPVLCRDISGRGFSFFTREVPQQRQMIVALGQVPFTFIWAEVVRIIPAEEADPAPLIVGCRFIGRVGEGS